MHAATSNSSAWIRATGGVLASVAACTFLWGWPEIVFPAQAKAGLAFGVAMGAPMGVAIWLTYWLCNKILGRAGRGGAATPGQKEEFEAKAVDGHERPVRLRVGGRAEKPLVL